MKTEPVIVPTTVALLITALLVTAIKEEGVGVLIVTGWMMFISASWVICWAAAIAGWWTLITKRVVDL